MMFPGKDAISVPILRGTSSLGSVRPGGILAIMQPYAMHGDARVLFSYLLFFHWKMHSMWRDAIVEPFQSHALR